MLKEEEIKKIKAESGATYVCKGCGTTFLKEQFGAFGRHLKACSKYIAAKAESKAPEVSEGKQVEGKDPVTLRPSGGFTSVKVTPITIQTKVRSKPKGAGVDQVDIKPIQEKIRREEWECRKCGYRWYPTQRPGKCVNCGSPRIQVKAIEEQLESAPTMNALMFRPMVTFPYDMWADRAKMEEIRLTPAEVDLLSENMASVANYYMADWMREHGIIIALVVAISMVTIPKMYLYRTLKKEREELPEEKPELSEKAQPDVGTTKPRDNGVVTEEVGTTDEEPKEEKEKIPRTERDKADWVNQMFSQKK